MTKYVIRDGDPTDRQTRIGVCIYCGADAIGEEHVIPAGAGGTLALDMASCRECEIRINAFETDILKTILYVPRVKLKVRRKRRNRPAPDRVRVAANISGKDVFVELPLKDFPSIFFLPVLDPPDFFLGKPARRELLTSGAWVRKVRPVDFRLPAIEGLRSLCSPVLNTQNFCRFLAKIAHGFAVYAVGLDGFEPMLTALIRSGDDDKSGTLVGGAVISGERSDNLHELSVQLWPLGSDTFIVVGIRLFAKLEAPTYLVVAGRSAAGQPKPVRSITC